MIVRHGRHLRERCFIDFHMTGANNDWAPGRWAVAAGPSHYRSAAKFVRQCTKSDRKQLVYGLPETRSDFVSAKVPSAINGTSLLSELADSVAGRCRLILIWI